MTNASPYRRIDKPEPGFFKIKLVRGGPFVPAAIMKDGTMFYAMINGECFSGHEDPMKAKNVFHVWSWGREIAKHEFDYMTAKIKHLTIHDRNHPLANPTKTIDITEQEWAF